MEASLRRPTWPSCRCSSDTLRLRLPRPVHCHATRKRRTYRPGIVAEAQELRQECVWGNSMLQVHSKLAQRTLDASERTDRQLLIGIAGVPGSGKSTLANAVARRINDMRPRLDGKQIAVVVGMDGFHFSREQLTQQFSEDVKAAFARRGAHWTFDSQGFVDAVAQLRRSGKASLPSFDHAEGDPVPDAIQVSQHHKIVLLEGNYLLLDIPPWSGCNELLNDSWFINCPVELAMERVLQRQVGNGEEEAIARHRVTTNDQLNAELIVNTQDRAKVLVLTIDEDTPEVHQ